MKRSAGILMPIFSLKSKYGIGCFSKEAYDFVDFLSAAKQKYWQILPIGPTSYGDSPYQSFSSFAGNHYFISLDDLVAEKLLKEEEIAAFNFKDDNIIDYEELFNKRIEILKLAFKRFKANEEYFNFISDHDWLFDYAKYMALKTKNNFKALSKWQDYNLSVEDMYNLNLHRFIQFIFYKQWFKLKKYANDKGIKIIGDLPFYASLDSADVFAYPNYFMINDKYEALKIAGCPPDYFSKEGQLWGNPIYNWTNLRKNNYDFLRKRLSWNLQCFDILRIDHFRAFADYYEIDVNDNDARKGVWHDGPGNHFFESLKDLINNENIIIEDLGQINDKVLNLIKTNNFIGMKVLEFAFNYGSISDYIFHRHSKNYVLYPATHDNETLVAWISKLNHNDLNYLKEYLDCDSDDKQRIIKSLIKHAYMSNCELLIVTLHDYLYLDDIARINKPSTNSGNWCYRIDNDLWNNELANQIANYVKLYER